MAAQWLQLPADFFGMIFDTASISTMHALIAARDFVDPECRTRGSRGDLVVYTSEQAHSSVEKGATQLDSAKTTCVRSLWMPDFECGRTILRQALEADVAAGKKPCCVVSTVGTTSTTSIDPVAEIVRIANEFGAWIHVDGAYGGSAAILPELRSHTRRGGTCPFARRESAQMAVHSYRLQRLYTNRPDVLRQALSLIPEYLRTGHDDSVVNLMDYGVPLGRRFRSLKLWFVMRYFGREGICGILRNHIAWAQELARQIRGASSFELAAPHPVCHWSVSAIRAPTNRTAS